MRKLKPTEPTPPVIGTGSDKNREVYALLLNLKIGERCIIEKTDWKGETPFEHAVYKQKLRRQFSLRKLIDKSGWVVTRVAAPPTIERKGI